MRKLHSYIPENQLQSLIDQALGEDIGDKNIGECDLTTNGALSDVQRRNAVKAKLVAKSLGTLSGCEIFKLVFETVAIRESTEITCNFATADGTSYKSGDVLAEISGPAGSILQAERTALNYIGRLSGIASLTAHYVAKVAHTKCRILDTRKTTPGWRALEKYAVNCGGGANHRIGLYDMVLIKENHIRAAGSITQAIENVRKYLKDSNKSNIAIEVEIQNSTELESALGENIDRVLLDNQSPEELLNLVTIARSLSPETKLEASGNITLETVANYAETGVDYISIGALTHSAKSADLSLLIT